LCQAQHSTSVWTHRLRLNTATFGSPNEMLYPGFWILGRSCL
jgi:hypothetical protein